MPESTQRPVFVSYSREDTDRVTTLVEALTDEDIAVFWDGNIGGGQRWRDVIPDAIDKAAAVVVVWTRSSVKSDWVLEEAARGKSLEVLMPVMFEGNVEIPFGFGEIQCWDLTGWAGERSPQFNQLVERLRAMVDRRRRGPYFEVPLWDDHTFDDAAFATSELRQLSGTLRQLGEVLATNRPVVNDVNAALGEVAKTYRVVRNAIEAFLSPAVESGPIDGKPYVEMESGSLESTIKNGRGHCTRILTLYRRHRGLRDAVKSRVDAKKLSEIDDAFDELSTADGDLFEQLSQIGWRLAVEAEVIATMLTAGRTEAARERIRDGRTKLQPLRKSLTAAIDDLQEAQEKLGYAESFNESHR